MFGFNPSFGVNGEPQHRFKQAIDIGVGHPSREIIFGGITLDAATVKVSRDLGEPSVHPPKDPVR